MSTALIHINDALGNLIERNISNDKYCDVLQSLNNLMLTNEAVRSFLGSIPNQRKFTELINIIQVAHMRHDSLAAIPFTESSALTLLNSDFCDVYESLGVDEASISDELSTLYLDPKKYDYSYLDFKETLEDPSVPDDEIRKVVDANQSAQISSARSGLASQEAINAINEITSLLGDNDKLDNTKSNNCDSMIDPDYWVRAVSFETPFMPNCDVHNVIYKTNRGDTEYRIYGEAVKPWNQSMIGLDTDVNAFSDSEVLSLFPEIRVYLRGNELYHPVEGLDFDDDLGVIFHIKGVTKKQMIKNLIEYPHVFQFDRWVRKQGTLTTIPFWKHIELNGEMKSTASVWGTKELPDTKKLPKTKLFMNEYVMRKYIIEENKGIEHKYKMRGEIWPFLTLYAPPEYYEDHGYDPLEVGRACIRARQHLCYTRNPIINMHKEHLVDSKS